MTTLVKALKSRSKKVNKVETTKASKDVMDVYLRLEEIAVGGYEKLTKEDSSYFLKCFGLFDKGVDGVHLFIGGRVTREAKEARVLHKSLPISEAKYHVKYLLKCYDRLKNRAETFEAFEERYLAYNYSYQAIGFYTKINYILNDKLDLNVSLELDKETKTYKKESLEIFDFGLKLFRLLTNQKRYVAVDNEFEIVLKDARKITRDEVTKLNPKVPKRLSEVIYMMTDNSKRTRASVFSELLVLLKGM